MRRHHRVRCVITACSVLVLIALGLPVAPVRAGGIFTLNSCDEGSFRTKVSDALAAGTGNTVLFGCSGGFSLTSGGGGTITISKDLTIDGNGQQPSISALQITPFVVAAATKFAISGLLIEGGGGVGVSGNGGGILNNSGTVTVTNSSFEALAAARGGGIYNNGGTVTVTNSSFISNRATGGGGGGLYNYQGTLRVTNSTFSGNSASDGGGIVNNSGTLIVTNSTFTGNTATGASACTGGGPSGGGICSVFSTLGNHYTALTNTLVANSTGGDLSGSGFLGNNNLVDDAAIGTGFTDGTSGNIVGHPAPLGRLCRCWNVTQAAPLLPGSAAIDAGTAVDSNYGTVPSKDQRDFARVGAPDIGAFESQGFTVTIVGGDHQSVPFAATFPAPLTVSVAANAANEQVTGGIITFTGPATGAGISPISVTGTIGGNGVTSGSASATVTANGTVGAYQVVASASGASPSVAFHLANAASLTGISPPSGATTGGGTITITGHGFGTSAANVAVMFGDASATIRTVTDTTIIATAPAHSTGTVDVVVTVNGAPGTLTQGYTYGTMNPLPVAQPTVAPVPPVGPLPTPRPANTALPTAPNPLPSPR